MAVAAGTGAPRWIFIGEITAFLDDDELVFIEDASAEPGADHPVGPELFIVVRVRSVNVTSLEYPLRWRMQLLLVEACCRKALVASIRLITCTSLMLRKVILK